jgi:hypothetical protein
MTTETISIESSTEEVFNAHFGDVLNNYLEAIRCAEEDFGRFVDTDQEGEQLAVFHDRQSRERAIAIRSLIGRLPSASTIKKAQLEELFECYEEGTSEALHELRVLLLNGAMSSSSGILREVKGLQLPQFPGEKIQEQQASRLLKQLEEHRALIIISLHRSGKSALGDILVSRWQGKETSSSSLHGASLFEGDTYVSRRVDALVRDHGKQVLLIIDEVTPSLLRMSESDREDALKSLLKLKDHDSVIPVIIFHYHSSITAAIHEHGDEHSVSFVEPWSVEQIGRFVEANLVDCPFSFAPEAVEYLQELTGGIPVFVKQALGFFLGELSEFQIGNTVLYREIRSEVVEECLQRVFEEISFLRPRPNIAGNRSGHPEDQVMDRVSRAYLSLLSDDEVLLLDQIIEQGSILIKSVDPEIADILNKLILISPREIDGESHWVISGRLQEVFLMIHHDELKRLRAEWKKRS